MTSFSNAVTKESKSKKTTTTNGMKARVTTANACVDLFFKAGASRGRDISTEFLTAYQENPEYALRILLWLRDIRGGAGERKLFRDLLLCMEVNHPEMVIKLLPKIPEVGRWDDLLIFKTKEVKTAAFRMIKDVLYEGIEANKILNNIDQLSEEQCRIHLDKFS